MQEESTQREPAPDPPRATHVVAVIRVPIHLWPLFAPWAIRERAAWAIDPQAPPAHEE